MLAAALTAALSEPPTFVYPVYPAAGLALAAAVVFGRVALPGVCLGAVVLGLAARALGLLPTAISLTQIVAISLGATAQAALGAELLRRYVSAPLSLNTPRAVLRAGLLGGLLASTISPTVGVLALWAGDSLTSSAALNAWWAWWLADATGVLLFAPVMLCFFGQPAADWRPRRRSVATPLLMALVLLAISSVAIERLQAQRALATYERDASRLANTAEDRLLRPVLALRALHSAVLTNPKLDDNSLQQASAWWLAQPYQLQAMGVVHRVVLNDGPQADTAVAANSTTIAATATGSARGPALRVYDLDNGRARAQDRELLVVQQVQPMPGHQALLGLNVLSDPGARVAALAARATGKPAASAGFTLPTSAADEALVVLYLALYDGQPRDEAARLQLFNGAVFLTLSVQQALKGLRAPDLNHLDWCLLDADNAAARRRLAGPPGCESPPQRAGNPHQQQRRLMLADRKSVV